MLDKQLDEEYVLICRSCLPKIATASQILPYLGHMQQACRKAFAMCYKDEIEALELTPPCVSTTKRQKLS